MKKIFASVFAIFLMWGACADDNAAVNEIISRYNASLGKAKASCAGLSEQIDKVKLMAGIGIGAGAVGTIAGGTALATGIMKSQVDDDIQKYLKQQDDLDNILKSKDLSNPGSLVELRNALNALNTQSDKMLTDAKNKSQTLGNIRTGGAFVAGAGGAVGAATSFSGTALLDKLAGDIDMCNSYVAEIEKQTTELRLESPDDPAIAGMSKIVESCKGLNSKNIADVKSKLTAGGILSVVGAAAGITGGITSAIAVSKEKAGASATTDGENGTKGLNMAANISSGVAAAGNLGGAILSGVVLSGFMKNGEIAEKCKNAF